MSAELEADLVAQIAAQGAISLEGFIGQCLAHPRWGYYMRKDPFGVAGDFVTAPEISQMFGELIGLWVVVVWQMMETPDPVLIVELGPGRGSLMADLLRAAALPAFRRAARIVLVETSPVLREKQRQSLVGQSVMWLESIEDLPPGPAIILANEFFDALPIRQFVKRGDGWHERLVGLRAGKLAFVDGEVTEIDAPEAGEGGFFEINQPARRIAARTGSRIACQKGVALIIDYGHAHSASGDTLQALRHHESVPPLETPGDADLTAHVDFEALATAALPAVATPVIGQGRFLRSLGIELRAEHLIKANPDRAQEIAAACARLINPEEMGSLFKVMAIAHPSLPPLPGFDL